MLGWNETNELINLRTLHYIISVNSVRALHQETTQSKSDLQGANSSVQLKDKTYPLFVNETYKLVL